jgi:ABC-type polar amino acid transport system ATPase subunit
MTSKGKPVLSVQNVDKSFDGRPILRDISFDIAAGETRVLVGSSGSGKSTLLRCIGLLETVDRGKILLEDQPIAEGGRYRQHESKADARLRANFGFVFQQFNLFGHKSAIENVMEGPLVVRNMTKSAAREKGMELLERVGVVHRAHAAISEMSGGEQQRVAIARALAMEPRVLLLDEPTSALDPELVGEVLDVVAQLAEEGMTMAIVTHEMGFAYEVADHVMFLANGTIHEEGPTHEILGSPSTPELKSFLRRFHYATFPRAT